MKRLLLFIFLNVTLTAAFCWMKQHNNALKEQVKSVSKKQYQLKNLLEENEHLEYPWMKKDWEVKKFLSQSLNINVLHDEVVSQNVNYFHRPHVLFLEGYVSGYLWYEDCYQVLKDLAEHNLPLWIKNLSIDRDIYENYNLQFSMSYIVGKINNP